MAKDSRLTKRQIKKLIKEQNAVVKKDPNNIVARLKLAGALKELGKDKEAVKHYQEVAKVYASTGKLVQAISVYKGILEIKPGHSKTEAALSELSAKRAQEIKAKSMPRLQQQDDGRWVMPTESDVSEEEHTDPGTPHGKVTTSTPSVLRLPAPMPSEESTSTRRRRARRSRPRLTDDTTSSTPSFESLDSLPVPEDGALPPPEGVDPSLPSLSDHESVAASDEPTPPPPVTAPVDATPTESVHVPPARVELPPERSPTPPPPPPSSRPDPRTTADDGGETVERDLTAEATDSVTATHRDAEFRKAGIKDGDLVLTAEERSPGERHHSGFLEDDVEELTSPGPSGYTDTIRKSAAIIDADKLKQGRAPRASSGTTQRRTLVGLPAAETPDLPQTPLTGVPAPDETATGEFVSPLAPAVDNKRTIQMQRLPDMSDAPTDEPELRDDTDDETLGSIFDEEEDAFWSELEGSADDTPPINLTTPRARKRPTLRASPAPAPSPEEAANPLVGRPNARRKSSKMTLPMGAAAFKKAVEEEEARQEQTSASKSSGAGTPMGVRLEEIALFRDLSETSREMLQSRLVRRDEKCGADIVREGDPGNALFVVSSGEVKVTKQDRAGNTVELAKLGPGAFFGEFALLSDRKRHATVTVSADGVFFEISRKVIADLTKSDPSFGNTLRQFYRRRLLGTLVRSAPFFDPLTEQEREALMGRLRFRRIPEKTKIITEGEPGGGFFLILIGEVEVTRTEPDGSAKVLSKLADGSYFGEMSLLKGGNAVATVTTVTPTEIVQLAAAEFYRILSKYPQIWEEVNREAKRRELANLQILAGHTPDPKPSDDSVVM